MLFAIKINTKIFSISVFSSVFTMELSKMLFDPQIKKKFNIAPFNWSLFIKKNAVKERGSPKVAKVRMMSTLPSEFQNLISFDC